MKAAQGKPNAESFTFSRMQMSSGKLEFQYLKYATNRTYLRKRVEIVVEIP
jgi:hypothetical protein